MALRAPESMFSKCRERMSERRKKSSEDGSMVKKPLRAAKGLATTAVGLMGIGAALSLMDS